MAKLTAVVSVFLIASACRRNPADQLNRLSEEFVYTSISFSPSTATSAGLHRYQNQNLDDLLDDMSPLNLDRQRRFYTRFRERLAALDMNGFGAEERADLRIMQDQSDLALLDLNDIHSHLHSPTLYVETLGNALFNPFVLEYAPLATRYRSIISRLEKVPLFLDQARTNLLSAPDVWTRVAVEENQGNIELVDRTLRAKVPAELAASYTKAARPALDAMQKFQDYLKRSLASRNGYDWRLGREHYARKFQYTLESGVDPESTLVTAERELGQVRARMLDLALALHRQLVPAHRDHEELSGEARQNQVIGEVLDKIAEHHSTPASYMDDARKDLGEARAFVEQKHLLTLSPRSNLQVIPTPEFMRGIYSVGGFNAAPALEPQLGAYYWITPISADWPQERILSKLREYNLYGLKLLTLHEAVPGHYVQGEIANDLQPAVRRLLRGVYGNGAYVEGWAVYSSQIMLEEGYLNHSPELALTFAKHQLRVIANAIIDIRLQMLGMPEQEARDLMEKQTFQEKEEATEKIQRAKLSSAQLATYFAGWRGWLSARDAYKQAKGAAFSLPEFHDRALKEGAVPLPVLVELLK